MLIHRNLALLGSLLASFISLALFLYLSNMSVPDVHASTTERNGPGQVVASSRYLRLAMFIIVNILISSCAVFSVVSTISLRFFFISDEHVLCRSTILCPMTCPSQITIPPPIRPFPVTSLAMRRFSSGTQILNRLNWQMPYPKLRYSSAAAPSAWQRSPLFFDLDSY